MGIEMGRNMISGRGMRRGYGRGRGRGMHGGRGMPPEGFQTIQDSGASEEKEKDAPSTSKQERAELNAQAQVIKQRMQGIKEQIARLEGGPLAPHPVAVVNAERCTGCGRCQTVCPVDAISIRAAAVIDRAKCTGCGRCFVECPQGALRVG